MVDPLRPIAALPDTKNGVKPLENHQDYSPAVKNSSKADKTGESELNHAIPTPLSTILQPTPSTKNSQLQENKQDRIKGEEVSHHGLLRWRRADAFANDKDVGLRVSALKQVVKRPPPPPPHLPSPWWLKTLLLPSPTLLLDPTPLLPLSPTIKEATSFRTRKSFGEELGLSGADAEAINRLKEAVVAPACPAVAPLPVSTSPPDDGGRPAGPQHKRHKVTIKDFEIMRCPTPRRSPKASFGELEDHPLGSDFPPLTSNTLIESEGCVLAPQTLGNLEVDQGRTVGQSGRMADDSFKDVMLTSWQDSMAKFEKALAAR
ncbi:hypothetical protein PtB15_8B186 [Puccinia triticina]|nr:hypothetical protein PtB15_8B186 [Puccinia triticina]